MENKDIMDDQAANDTEQPDNLTTENPTAETSTTDDGTDAAASQPSAATRELAEQKEKYLRLYADFENFRRRTAKEKLDIVNSANENLLKALIPVVDDFQRALQSIESTDDIAAVKEGVELIYTKFMKTLESKGLKPMVAKGQPFDADLHESITQFPAPSDDLRGKVIDEVEKGYYLNDKVIRFAKVIVGS